MGGGGSKTKGTVKSTKGAAAAPVPVYSGPPCQYQFISVQASMQSKVKLSLSLANETTSTINVNSYVPRLQEMYAAGYRLLSFTAKPSSIQTHGIASPTSADFVMEFQGIFRTNPTDGGGKSIRVEKTILQAQSFISGGLIAIKRDAGSVADSSHMFQTIANVTQEGGRLVCIEMIKLPGAGLAPAGGAAGGGAASMGFGNSMQVTTTGPNIVQSTKMGLNMLTTGQGPAMTIPVDIFFEMGGGGEQYNYQIEAVPIKATCQPGFGTMKWNLNCDWQNPLNKFLSQGWKLVEIFSEPSTNMQTGLMSAAMTVKTLFIFEKPLSRMNDPTPIYEGTMVEYVATGSADTQALGFGGMSMHIQANWEPTLETMGRSGWEVVRILSTPGMSTKPKGLTSSEMQMKYWIFFQRERVSSSTSAPQTTQMPATTT